MAYENKMIIHNVAKVPDDVAIEMVLRVIKKGRHSRYCVYKPKKFESGYLVTPKKSVKSETDVFFITKVDKDA